ncbi:ORF6C domain-containing protein [Enterococcus spodopteracolus]|uniref:ORF6C domain-containing protein n=1 Tax=Enterococcus spodopteracolus TaxID=3034501 RepID=UPI002648C59E|nr:ORF6C domain-containing protein [Enterococcus spodopteracolus]
MDELIKTYKNEQNETLVNGRELHKYLEVKTRYNDWFTDMIQYGFIENVDFTSFTEKRVKPSGGRPSIDHALKLDMAKEVSMIQRTEKGRQARQYFIDVEKRYNAAPMDNTELLLQTALQHQRGFVVVNERLDRLETETTINTSQRRKIKGAVTSTVIKVLGGKKSNAYRDASIRSTTFSQCYKELREVYDVASYMDIPKVKNDEAMSFIPKWQPRLELQIRIDFANGKSDLWAED